MKRLSLVVAAVLACAALVNAAALTPAGACTGPGPALADLSGSPCLEEATVKASELARRASHAAWGASPLAADGPGSEGRRHRVPIRRRGVATIKGGAYGKPVDATINKYAGLIDWGGTKLTIDFENRVIKSAEGEPPIELHYDWAAGRLWGGNTDVTYDMEKGTIKGGIFGKPIDLVYDHPTGRITGGANGHSARLLYDHVTGRIADADSEWKPVGSLVDVVAWNLTPAELFDTYLFILFGI